MLMKKIFTFLFAAVLAVSAYANEQVVMADSIQGVMAQESPTNPGNVTIIWKADSTKSSLYLVYLYSADMTTYKTTPIAYLLSYPKNFAVPGYPGYFSVSSGIMLQYGATYMSLKDDTSVPADMLAAFKEGWENNVDASDLTLNAGYYYITVTGYDAQMQVVTEARNAAIVNVVGKAQAIENIFESKKPVKFIENGQVRILRDGKVYDMSGALVR